MPELGRGMLFPRRYFADQFTPAQEKAMEAAQAAAEDADPNPDQEVRDAEDAQEVQAPEEADGRQEEVAGCMGTLPVVASDGSGSNDSITAPTPPEAAPHA